MSAFAGPSSATFLASDATTKGAWKGAYGGQGYNVFGDAASLPVYATVTPAGKADWTWAASTTDARALQKAAAGSTDRISGCWYSPTSFTVGVNITDGSTRKVSLYMLDWDSLGRNQKVEVLDAAGNVLDARTISGFSGGMWLSWNVTGAVMFRATNLNGGDNAVLNGLFFG